MRPCSCLCSRDDSLNLRRTDVRGTPSAAKHGTLAFTRARSPTHAPSQGARSAFRAPTSSLGTCGYTPTRARASAARRASRRPETTARSSSSSSRQSRLRLPGIPSTRLGRQVSMVTRTRDRALLPRLARRRRCAQAITRRRHQTCVACLSVRPRVGFQLE